jgi:hypothetical protein
LSDWQYRGAALGYSKVAIVWLRDDPVEHAFKTVALLENFRGNDIPLLRPKEF